jgi:hypothetical protein
MQVDVQANRVVGPGERKPERYGGKPWTLAEHESIRSRLMETRSSPEERDKLRILPIRVGEGQLAGINFNTTVPDVRRRPKSETAELILNRLSLISHPHRVALFPYRHLARKRYL